MIGMLSLSTPILPLAMASSSQPAQSTAVAIFLGLTPSRQADVIEDFMLRVAHEPMITALQELLPGLREGQEQLPMSLVARFNEFDIELGESLTRIVQLHELTLADTTPLTNSITQKELYQPFGRTNRLVRSTPLTLRHLSAKNPIIELFNLEADFVTPREIDLARQILARIFTQYLADIQSRTYSIEEALVLLHKTILDADLSILTDESQGSTAAEARSHLFTQNLLEQEIDCDDEAFIYYAIGGQFKNWPIHLGLAGDHLVTLWTEKRATIVVDFGEIFSINDYEQRVIHQTVVPLTPEQITGFFYFNRGLNFYEEQDDVLMALSSINKAIENYHLRVPIAYWNRGIFFHEMNEYQAALDDYERALASNPHLLGVDHNLGVVHYQLGHFQKAQTYLRRHLQNTPYDSVTHYYLGRTLQQMGQEAEAQHHLQTAQDLDPEAVQELQDRRPGYLS